jgi:two-component system, OmpR family, response regulator
MPARRIPITDPPVMCAMPRSLHILVVDDDREIRGLLTKFLTANGFRVTPAADGQAMAQAMKVGRFDLIILDIMLPGEDGLSLCRKLRGSDTTPIIMLTAVGGDTDRIVGLELGADDYLTKPFNPRELLARIKAVMRRTHALPPSVQTTRDMVYGFAGWRLHTARRALHSPEGVLVPLSAGEYELLLAFTEHPQRILTREQLLDLARGRSSVLFDRSIDVQVYRLRRKIEVDAQAPLLIKTVRAGGYMFTPAVTTDAAPEQAA